MLGTRSSQSSIGRHGRRFAAAALLALAAPALALAEEAPAEFPIQPPTFGLRIDRSKFLPRVTNELESFSAFELLSQPGTGLRDHAMFQVMSDKIKQDGERVTRRALRDHLIELTGLDRTLASERSAGDPKRPMRFTFGTHGLRPEIGMKYRVGDAAFGFRVDSSGELGLSLFGSGAGRSGITASFDGDDSFALRARLGF